MGHPAAVAIAASRWLGSAERRDLFLWVLEQMRQRYSFVVVGYVVTPGHFHLLISEPQDETPSTVIQAVKLGFVQRLPVGRSGGVNNGPTSRTEREKWGTTRMEAKKPTRFSEDYWRAAGALHWIEGDVKAANEAWEKANALAQQPPKAGAYEFDRYCCSLLRQALDEVPVAR